MRKRLWIGLLALSLIFSSTTVYAEESGAYSNKSSQITIFHTNDVHGYLEGDGESSVGISKVAGLKDENPDSILVDAGDATQGLPIASLTKGNDVIRLMNMAGYDLMVPGNHEFDFGTDAFLKNVSLAEFPIISANIYRDGTLLLEGKQEKNPGCHTVIEKNGIKVGFFGLTTTQTATATNPTGIQGVEFVDEIESAKKEIDHLENEGADIIIAVAHLGDETADVPCTSTDLAEAMTDEYQGKLDVIIDGHSHTVEDRKVNDIEIVQTGTGLSAVGKLTLNVENDGSVTAAEALLSPADLANVTPDSEVETELQRINASQEELLGESIGTAGTTLWAGWIGNIAPTRFVETNYGNLAADAFADAGRTMLKATGTGEDLNMPVIAVENGGGIREAVSNGEITVGDLATTFPFSNTLYMKKVTPSVLYQVMEQSGSLLEGQDTKTGMLIQSSISGGFLQISGFKVVFNPDGGTGNHVVSITLDGQTEPLDRNDNSTELMMVSNNYIMSGGNDYTMLADLPKYAEAGGELETIESYITKNLSDGILEQYQGTEGRISYTGSGYVPSDYTASIQIINNDGTPYSDQEITYRVDGGEGLSGKTDKEGILKVKVRDGGHGIRVSDTQNEVYIDNYAGIGIIEDELRQIPQLQAPEKGQEIIVNNGQNDSGSGQQDQNTSIEDNNNSNQNNNQQTINKTVVKEKESISASPKTGDKTFAFPAAAAVFSSFTVLYVFIIRRKNTENR